MTGTTPELLADIPPLPPAAAHVWAWFCECRRECKQGQRVTPTIMQALEWSNGVKMQLWERQALRALDTLLLRVPERDD